jgi:outer membrane protein assembly factor BamC
MMIQRSTVLLAAFLQLGLGGCALFGDKTGTSPTKVREALEVPPDLARPASDDLSAVPSSGTAAYSDYTVKTPANATGSAYQQGVKGQATTPVSAVRLERDGAQRWLVVQGNPERTWVKVRDYFLRNKKTLTVENPKTGVLETDWIDRPVKFTSTVGQLFSMFKSTGLRDKFRVRVEQGREPGTAEVFVSHQCLTEVVVSGGGVDVLQTAWQPIPAEPEQEAEMLGKLLVHFGLDEQQAKGQVATADEVRAQIIKGKLLLANEELDAAWRRVGQALDRAGVITEDRDRSAGIFYVRYLDSGSASKRQGAFSWLLSDSGNTSDGKKELSNDRFQVRLKAIAAGTSVAVFNVNGEPEKSPAGEQLLGVLQLQLQ